MLCAMRRREFLTLSAATIGGVLVYSLDRKAFRLCAQEKPVRIPLRFFTEEQALIIAAAASRIFPGDDTGPGAREAGVVIYIDRQLAGPYGRDRHRYTQPPFEDGPAELGYQGGAAPRQIYLDGLKGLAGFDRLSPEEQDSALRKIEGTLFFSLLRAHTMEGMFCDPMHGGNVDMVGWLMIGFPGPRPSNLHDVDKHFGEAFRPEPAGIRETMDPDVVPGEEQE